jgi:ATP-binding cassette, subfamily F, member 3
MLTAHQIYKTYAVQPVLVDVTFSINQGEHVGLIGPNGCGKTTLLRILAGNEQPDTGIIVRSPGDSRIAYLSQGFESSPRQTMESFTQRSLGNPEVLEKQLERYAQLLAQNPQDKDLQKNYDDTLQALARLESRQKNKLFSILSALDLNSIPADHPLETLSGGQKTRLALANVLLQDPQMLLLDEPTNHLDIAMLEWLERWLLSFSGGALIVSHDRTFLDNTTTRILDLNPDTHSILSYTGNYTAYLGQYLNQVEKHWTVFNDQQAEIRRMSQDIARTKEQARWVENTTTSRQPTVRRYAKKVAKKAISREKKLDRYLNAEDRVEKPKIGWQMKLDFDHSLPSGKEVLHLEQLSVGYSPAHPLLTSLNLFIRAGDRIVLTGPNGSGKSTLLRTIAGQLTPLAGSFRFGPSIHTGYMDQEQALLDFQLNAVHSVQKIRPINETEARSFLHFFLFSGDEALKPIPNLSFGERARLALALLVLHGNNFLLLDEPINHLDIPSRERFEQALAAYEGTVVAVVHDRYFINRFATQLWLVDNQTIYREVLVSEITD